MINCVEVQKTYILPGQILLKKNLYGFKSYIVIIKELKVIIKKDNASSVFELDLAVCMSLNGRILLGFFLCSHSDLKFINSKFLWQNTV